MSYVDRVIEQVKAKDSEQPEFIQAVTEVLKSLEPVIESNPAYEKAGLLERIVEPERVIMFRVPWVDDEGNVHVNRGYRVQFNSCLGPYKGGLRLHPSVNLGIIKFLGFEQIFKNSLTTLPMGGGKGGCDFDPKGKSDLEVMRFCQSFMTELYRHIGADTDVPAGDIGTGAREVGFMFGQYKRIKNVWEGVLTGKGLAYGGSLARTEATGYGLIYFVQEYLNCHDDSFEGKTVAVSGSGNVAIYATQKAQQLGATVVTLSDSTGWIHDPAGIDVDLVKQIKEVERGRISEYAKRKAGVEYHDGRGVWSVPVRHRPALRHAERAPHRRREAARGERLQDRGRGREHAHHDGCHRLPHGKRRGVLPRQGGERRRRGHLRPGDVARTPSASPGSFEEVDAKLQGIMKNIYHAADDAAKEYGHEGNYVMGANIAGFKKLADAMMAQGIV